MYAIILDTGTSKFITRVYLNESDAIEGRILVGSAGYFQLLASCFKKIKSTCTGESCIVSESMSKRLENVRHIDLMKKALNQTAKCFII